MLKFFVSADELTIKLGQSSSAEDMRKEWENFQKLVTSTQKSGIDKLEEVYLLCQAITVYFIKNAPEIALA